MYLEKAWIKAVEGCCAWDDVAGLAGVRRYYGRTIKGNAPGDIIPGGQKVAATWHVRRLLRKGELLPMDEETAHWAGVQLSKREPKKTKKTEID